MKLAHALILLYSGIWCIATGCLAQNGAPRRYFDGLHLGANAGSQNLFGGSLVNGIDVLAQDARFVTELFTGFRKQFLKDRLLAGVEFQIGFTDGDLIHNNPDKSLTINYKNSFQSGYGLTLGGIFFKKKILLAYAYAFETERKFDVTIRDAFSTYKQKDEQGMLKYGLGLEVKAWRGLHARATAGRLRVDFGNQETNIRVDDKWDFMAGVAWQFHIKFKR